ncbi:MAG: ABC transporter permease [Solirubrobacterales bacterium]|nr:ABC transporter permease [Solirubrobacterales bacterium]MCB8970637.1 ABC transporter permease [Thermoleophilales bacterium]MCO5326427.1 ABC transporter permease [Solirubrobacterales bacterium]
MAVALRSDLTTIAAMLRRSANELIRVPGAAIPGVLAPTIFFLGLTSVFGSLTLLPGFDTDSYKSFMIPVSMLQGAGFTGAAAGVNLARDIEIGLFDRFLASPAPRWVLLTGTVAAAAVRSLIPATVLLIVALAVGAHSPGLDGLVVAIAMVMGTAVLAACWGVTLALRFKTQSAAPLMQSAMLALILSTTAYAPQDLLTGWLATVAAINPMTQVVDATRQGFVGGVTWAGTWPGIVALLGFVVVLGAFALRGMRRTAF